MAASRQSWNLFKGTTWSKYGVIRCFLRHPRVYAVQWKLMFQDTFMPFACWFLGHRIHDANLGSNGRTYGPPAWACKRCSQYVRNPIWEADEAARKEYESRGGMAETKGEIGRARAERKEEPK